LYDKLKIIINGINKKINKAYYNNNISNDE